MDCKLENFKMFKYDPHSIGQTVASATCKYLQFEGEVTVVTCYNEWEILNECIYKVVCIGTITKRKTRKVKFSLYHDTVSINMDDKSYGSEQGSEILDEKELREFMVHGVQSCTKWH